MSSRNQPADSPVALLRGPALAAAAAGMRHVCLSDYGTAQRRDTGTELACLTHGGGGWRLSAAWSGRSKDGISGAFYSVQ